MNASVRPAIFLPVAIVLAHPLPSHAGNTKDIVRSLGDKIVVGPANTEIRIRGIGIANNVWAAEQDTVVLYANHGPADFDAIAEMGMNVIRFYMNYETFEDDANPFLYKESGWRWIDRNIA